MPNQNDDNQQIPGIGSSQPDLPTQLYNLQHQYDAPGVLGILQKVVRVANGIGNPNNFQEIQNQQMAQNLANIPDAKGLPDDYKPAAAQLLNQGKFQEFNFMLKDARYAQHEAQRQQKEQEFSDLVESKLPSWQKQLSPDAYSIVEAKHKGGDSAGAASLALSQISQGAAEKRQLINAGIQNLNDQEKSLPETDKTAENASAIIADMMNKKISPSDLQNIKDPSKVGWTKAQLTQANNVARQYLGDDKAVSTSKLGDLWTHYIQGKQIVSPDEFFSNAVPSLYGDKLQQNQIIQQRQDAIDQQRQQLLNAKMNTAVKSRPIGVPNLVGNTQQPTSQAAPASAPQPGMVIFQDSKGQQHQAPATPENLKQIKAKGLKVISGGQ